MRLLTPLLILWALPWSCVGACLGLLGLFTGGGVQRRGRVLEFWGPGIAWYLRTFSRVAHATAVTFGHTIICRTRADLDRVRAHELVHVRQYERWGPFFVPAYLVCWFYLWLKGRNGYLDNPFEKEAFATAATTRET